MANKLPWATPKVQTLYTTSSVGRLIAEYLDAGGQMLQMREKENGGSFPAVFLSSVKGHNNQKAERNHCADGNKWMMFQHEREKRDVFITGCGIIVLDGLVSGDDHRKNDKYPHIIT